MSAENQNMYGYQSDEVAVSPFNFGLNAGVTILKKFEWIMNGGKDGAEGEALDIIFEINGKEKSYRQFPVTKAFTKEGAEVTDPSAPEMEEARKTFSSVITHILGCFVAKDKLQAAFNQPITNFKHYCTIAMNALPRDFATKKLDIFMQYQWNIREGQNRTYLEIPKSMKNGKWLCEAVTPVGEWKEERKEKPTDSDQKALRYVDGGGNEHPFTRYGRYMKGNLANQQKTRDAQAQDAAAANIAAPGAGTSPATNTAASGW
jgi:hypothetical protein